MNQEVEKGKRLNNSTIQYLPCFDWEQNLVQFNDRPAPADSIDYPRFLYDPKDRPVFSN